MEIEFRDRDANGKVVEWMERVINEQYLASPKSEFRYAIQD